MGRTGYELVARVSATVAERNRVTAELVTQGWRITPSEADFAWLPLGDRAAANPETIVHFGHFAAAGSSRIRNSGRGHFMFFVGVTTHSGHEWKCIEHRIFRLRAEASLPAAARQFPPIGDNLHGFWRIDRLGPPGRVHSVVTGWSDTPWREQECQNYPPSRYRAPFRDSQSGMWIFHRHVLNDLRVRAGGMAFWQQQQEVAEGVVV